MTRAPDDIDTTRVLILQGVNQETGHLDEQQITEVLHDLAADFQTLDRHLLAGGNLPTAWQNARPNNETALDRIRDLLPPLAGAPVDGTLAIVEHTGGHKNHVDSTRVYVRSDLTEESARVFGWAWPLPGLSDNGAWWEIGADDGTGPRTWDELNWLDDPPCDRGTVNITLYAPTSTIAQVLDDRPGPQPETAAGHPAAQPDLPVDDAVETYALKAVLSGAEGTLEDDLNEDGAVTDTQHEQAVDLGYALLHAIRDHADLLLATARQHLEAGNTTR
ncbi:hypothetical protein [Actinoplanes sp. NBRC 101535]|uniref:hypothetical protein n=1 Tax=Actinoplanes sp. NBRC 101535 TaxID=3032196 RepID=UPI0024A49AB9|nr:hypothetical protein [Actinoplanes sp. NBRC 101535]GLY08295.1 hypothetical protein Acsp01_86740 [Actinoplanes sp. NBRC 101535]